MAWSPELCAIPLVTERKHAIIAIIIARGV